MDSKIYKYIYIKSVQKVSNLYITIVCNLINLYIFFLIYVSILCNLFIYIAYFIIFMIERKYVF